MERTLIEVGPETVAAFIAEPVVGAAAGGLVPPPGYFAAVREICDRYGILFIADEVITGFGRLGRWFGVEHFGVQPDILVFAKGIAAGYAPLGGFAGPALADRAVPGRLGPLRAQLHLRRAPDRRCRRRGGREDAQT